MNFIRTRWLTIFIYVGRMIATSFVRLLATVTSSLTFLENASNISQELKVALMDIVIQAILNSRTLTKAEVDEVQTLLLASFTLYIITMTLSYMYYDDWVAVASPVVLHVTNGLLLANMVRLTEVLWNDSRETMNFKNYNYDLLLSLRDKQESIVAKPINESKFFIGEKE